MCHELDNHHTRTRVMRSSLHRKCESQSISIFTARSAQGRTICCVDERYKSQFEHRSVNSNTTRDIYDAAKDLWGPGRQGRARVTGRTRIVAMHIAHSGDIEEN